MVSVIKNPFFFTFASRENIVIDIKFYLDISKFWTPISPERAIFALCPCRCLSVRPGPTICVRKPDVLDLSGSGRDIVRFMSVCVCLCVSVRMCVVTITQKRNELDR